MFSHQQMQPGWHSPNSEVEQITNKMSADPRLPRTSPISPYVSLPQMRASPNPLAAAHHAALQAQQHAQQAAQHSMHQYSAPQYYHHGVQTSPLMLGTAFNGRVMATQTSPMQMMYANTQTSPQPLSPPTPGPVDFGPSPATSSRSSRSSSRYGFGADERVCERCGEGNWVTKEQYFVLRMRRKAARFAMRHYHMSPPASSMPRPHTSSASHPCREGSFGAVTLPRPSPSPAHQPTAAVSPSAWRPWTAPSMDYQTVRSRAENAIQAHRRIQTHHKVTSTATSYTEQEPAVKDEKC